MGYNKSVVHNSIVKDLILIERKVNVTEIKTRNDHVIKLIGSQSPTNSCQKTYRAVLLLGDIDRICRRVFHRLVNVFQQTCTKTKIK